MNQRSSSAAMLVLSSIGWVAAQWVVRGKRALCPIALKTESNHKMLSNRHLCSVAVKPQFGRDGEKLMPSLLLTVVLSITCALAQQNGMTSCPCIQYDAKVTAPDYVSGPPGDEKLIYQPTGSGIKYEYPLNYGSSECKAHDSLLPPICDAEAPRWCSHQWCYVDRSECDLVVSRSKFFPGETNLYYSYATCNEGAVLNSFERWALENVDGTSQLVDLVQGYLQASRGQIERAYKDVVSSGSAMQQCDFAQMCGCVECQMNDFWRKKIDTADVGFWPRSNNNLVSCLCQALAFTYRKVAASESDATASRIGYQYFADQLTGSYAQWPNVEYCPDVGYDPRFRPWYAAGATGPKDVVIVIDVSGSMDQENRHQLAKNAVKAILNTLTWKDHASIVQFDSDVVGVFSKTLVSVTHAQRAVMHRWVDNSDGARGGTDFKQALFGNDGEHPGAFKIIRDSVSQGKTSMCQKVIMFLTDGSADFSDDDFRNAHAQAVEHNVIFFTYALGSGAESSVTTRLACENNGIYYNVNDGADLGRIMAGYYAYFAAGQEICGSSFVEYRDTVTGTQLYAGCMSMYDRTGTDASLLGVSCLDLNLIASIGSMKAKAGWRDMISKMSDMTKMCRPLYLHPCHLEQIRLKSSHLGAGTCGGASSSACPCLSRQCKDDSMWIDEKGYFCDTWIGDDCNEAVSKWGYTAQGATNVLNKCKRSCGLCEWKQCEEESASCSEADSMAPQESRACQTSRVSGVDIEGCYMSCGKQGSPFYSAERDCDTVVDSAPGQNRFIALSCALFVFHLWELLFT